MGNPQKHFKYEGAFYSVLRQNERYGVSIDGVVVHRSKGRVEPSESPSGYLYVTLGKNGRNQKFFVHRLVLEYYTVTYDPEFLYVHKDENKKNNRLDNLAVYHAQFVHWRKQAKDREKAAAKDRKKAEAKKKPKPKPKPDFKQLTIKCEETGEIFASVRKCAKAFGVSPQWVSKVLRNPKQSVNGYTLTVVDPI